MQKLSRTAALVGLGLFLVVVIAFIGANLYVQAQATQARIQQELRQRLGVDVRMGQISVTPWAGIVLSGITVPQAGSPPFPLPRVSVAAWENLNGSSARVG